VSNEPAIENMELTLDAVRTTYDPPPDVYPQTLIDHIHLDWPEVNGAAEYAIYRSDLFLSSYIWVEIATVPHPTSEYDNIRTGPYAIDFDKDYIYEIRARAVAGDAGSEFLTSQQALVIMESNDTGGSGNPLWSWEWGVGDFSGYWYHMPQGADEEPPDSMAFFYWMASQIEDGWEIFFCPGQIPDLEEQSMAYFDFAFTKGPYYYFMPEKTTGWAPGTMSMLPSGGEKEFPPFDAAPDSGHLMGVSYNPDFAGETFETYFGEVNGAFCGNDYDPFKATRYEIPDLLESDVDFVGIAIAAHGPGTYKAYICYDSIAVVVY
jgi:hypothetical protein